MTTLFQQRSDAQRQALAAPPTLPVQYANVRPVNGAIVYTFEGTPIPQDQWSMVPVSAGIVNAIKYGDLEEGEPIERADAEQQHDHRRHRNHRSHRRHRAEEA